MACAASTTLIVVMPIAAAGFRLMPRSSRKTHSSGCTSEQLAGDLVEARFGFAHADLAALDDHVESVHDRGDLDRTRVAREVATVATDDVVGEACHQ